MTLFIEKILSMPLAAKLLVAISTASLSFALIMQLGFGLEPCVLCLWQRGPFVVTIMLSLLAWGWRPYRHHTYVILLLCALTFLVGMGLAIFHTGVEHHWWLGTSGCAVHALNGTSTDDIRQTLLNTVAPRCDHIAWTILGLSMANLNIGLSLFLAMFAMAAAVCVKSQSRRIK